MGLKRKYIPIIIILALNNLFLRFVIFTPQSR